MRKAVKTFFAGLPLWAAAGLGLGIGIGSDIRAQIPYPTEEDLHTPFIDSLISTMTPEDMAAQTMVIRSKAVPTPEYIVEMRRILESHPYGGICFFAGTTADMLTLQQDYKAASRLPLLMTIDGEFGPGMRMTDLIKFPRQQTLGALSDESLIYEMGRATGRQCRELGIQWNFIPVVDVNNNAENPVINTRSFGENPADVSRRASLYLKGMQREGVMGSAKHFPGHGDTRTDSHLALPLINLSREDLERIHLQPFKDITDDTVESVMVGHLNIPAYDSSGLPASLSRSVITGLLREKLGFQGLIVTDGLEMQGVRKALKELPAYKSLGEGSIEVQALLAGCDVLLLPEKPETAVNAVAQAVRNGTLERSRLEDAVRRVLYYKFHPCMAENYKTRPQASTMHNLPRFIADSINGLRTQTLLQRIFDHSVTVMDNMNRILPLSHWAYPYKTVLHIGNGQSDGFGQAISELDSYAEHIYLDRDFDYDKTVTSSWLERLSQNNLLIIGITHTNYSPARQYGITPQTLKLVETLQELDIPVVLCVFAPPYAMLPFYNMPHISASICGYQDVEASYSSTARILYGALPSSGRLPVTVAPYWPAGFGIKTQQQILDRKRNCADVGMSQSKLDRVDSLAKAGWQEGAYPGCQILICKKGAVVYDKCFGRATYDEESAPVEPGSLYDLASLTKVLATTLAYMRLYENGYYRLDEPIRNFIPRLSQTDKKNITFRQLLCHHAGLKPFLTYVENDDKTGGKPVFDENYSSAYPIQVADSLYLQRNYAKEIQKRIDESPVCGKPGYVYSDLGFYYLNEALQKMTDTTLDAFVSAEFYSYLGLETLGFHPGERFPLYRIMPTENDTVLRKRQIHGFVHDPLGALSGGVAGSAGLFGNAHDVAVIGQMLLQKGFYGGIQFFDTATVNLFTSSDFSPAGNRRGGGFDKPALRAGEKTPTAPSASPSSFGHSGFTGTYIWVDPEEELVYVFLSNRIYPDAHNKKLITMGIRTAILEALY